MNKLPLVDPSEVLLGQGPLAFERLARSAQPLSKEHIGLVSISTALSARAIRSNIPPSAQKELQSGLAIAQAWLRKKATEQEVKNARAQCFQALSAIESTTVHAVQEAQKHLSQEPATPLDHHAKHVVKRYSLLAAHFTVSAICHTLDTVETPQLALLVLQDVEGARAYQAAGLGAARHSSFRQAAYHQAEWEVLKVGKRPEESMTAPRNFDDEKAAIAVQVFHEYLGGRWRMHADAERIKNTEFLNWALGGLKTHKRS